jgi:aminobenzoyl-glutamate transport protein
VYGIGAKTLKSNDDVINGMGRSMSTLGTYIVLVFFAAQFVAYFNWTNLGLIFAIKGANLIGSLELGRIPLMIALVFISAIINLVVGSASAKWAILAPVFIPMFMLLGYSPEFTQLGYRVGDSVTNVIAPMMSYFAMIVAFIEKYDKKAGIGTIYSHHASIYHYFPASMVDYADYLDSCRNPHWTRGSIVLSVIG